LSAYRFRRCTAVRSDGARCWRSPHDEGKHVCLKPGEIPSADSIKRIASLHPDADSPQTIMMMAALEPVGKATPEGMAQAADLLQSVGLGRR
jgi:hypothetical protein